MMRIGDLVRATHGVLVSGRPNDVCLGVSIDTRTLRPGDLFFALQGPRFDGHNFLTTAAEKARCVLPEIKWPLFSSCQIRLDGRKCQMSRLLLA